MKKVVQNKVFLSYSPLEKRIVSWTFNVHENQTDCCQLASSSAYVCRYDSWY